ncbi:MAG: PorP/SprF family type IX secretion system membrane protein [Bacteroidia bacterium]
MNKLYIGVALLTLSVSAQAQNLPFDFYSFKMNNMYNVNPAYTGKTDGVNIILDARAQSKGVPNATKNLMTGVHGKFTDNQAIGGRIVSDGRGAFQVLKADFTYASKIKLATDHALTLGLSAGVFNKSLAISRIENYSALDQTDPTLSYFNTTQFIGGVGALYTYKTLEVSLSSPHLVETSQAVNQFLNASAAYTFKASKDINVTPWVSYQNVPVIKNIAGLFVKSSYKDLVWLQVGYQSNSSFGGMFGANIGNFGLGYGFQLNNKATKTIAVGTHEIAFTFKINKRNKGAINTNDNSNASMLSIINRLDNLTANKNMSKAELRAELEKIKVELKKLSASNFAGENPDTIEQNINVIDKKIKEIEAQL